MVYDPNQRFINLVPGGNGIFYAIQADGELLWYRHSGWATGAATWASGSGRVLGVGWHQFTFVMAGSDGQIFAVRADGSMHWYRYVLSNTETGAGQWHPSSGAQIGSGFNQFPRMFGGFDGVFYGLDGAGDLYWFRYSGIDGTNTWGANSGSWIGSGWNQYMWLWADPSGVIYGARQGGTLAWWRYVVSNTTTGAGTWANKGAAIEIGDGWGDSDQKFVFSNTGGTIYSIQLDDSTVPGMDNTLVWNMLSNTTTVNTTGTAWSNSGVALTISTGITHQAEAALQGYPSAISTPQGGSVGIQVSTTWPDYTATILRLAPSGASGAPVTAVPATSYSGRFQQLPTGYRSAGCGWSTDFTVSPTSTWASGVYTARLNSPAGNQHDVVFVVRPQTPQNKIAVLLPTSTYHAYNTWGGHDQYTLGEDTTQRVMSLLRPSNSTTTAATGFISHTLYSDLLLLDWMTANNIAFDVYSDGDIDATGSTWLSSYKALVLCSHPEYWTQTARQNVINYTSAGGRVIATGGNCIYEEVSYSPDGNTVTYRIPTGDRNLFENLNEFESPVIGLEFNSASYMDFYPYKVETNHAFLNGTGLVVGSTFGADGYNGAASGWEIDWATDVVTGQVIIAAGQNPAGGGSMCYVPFAKGGWAFTTGSIAFNGAIPSDTVIQKILSNVFAAAVL